MTPARASPGPKAHVKGPLGDHRHERVARAPREDAAVPSPAPDSNEDVSYLDRGLGLLDGDLASVLAAGVKRVERALDEMEEGYWWRQGRPTFHFSSAAAALFGLFVALDSMLRELHCEPQGHLLDLEIDRVFNAARSQLQRLPGRPTQTLAPLTAISALQGARFDGPRGIGAFSHWRSVSRLAAKAYAAAYRAVVREAALAYASGLGQGPARSTPAPDEAWWPALPRGMAVPTSPSVAEWHLGGYLRLLGLESGFSLVTGVGSVTEVETGIRDLVRVFHVGQAPLGFGAN
jgi:hypothetical protein